MKPVNAERAVPIEEYESEFNGWQIHSWKWSNDWNVTAELFDRVNLKHGICWGHGSTREDAEKVARARILSNEKVNWTQYTKLESGLVKQIANL